GVARLGPTRARCRAGGCAIGPVLAGHRARVVIAMVALATRGSPAPLGASVALAGRLDLAGDPSLGPAGELVLRSLVLALGLAQGLRGRVVTGPMLELAAGIDEHDRVAQCVEQLAIVTDEHADAGVLAQDLDQQRASASVEVVAGLVAQQHR